MEERPIQVGDWVDHPEFGEGLVLESRGSGESATVTVSFSDRTQRKLLIRLARLTVLEGREGKGTTAEPEGSAPKKRRRRSGA